jgi:putative copper export protein
MHEHAGHLQLEATLRGLLYLGSFALLGAGLFSRWIGPERSREQPRRLWGLLWAGGLLVAGSSLYFAYHTAQMIGSAEFFWPYLLQTQQGNYLLLRLALAVGLLALGLGGTRPLQRLLHAALALGFLLTLSTTAHAGAKGGLALIGDLAHLVAGVSWGGNILALALTWESRPSIQRAVQRFSNLSLLAAGLFVGTGLLLGLVQTGDLKPSALSQHAYGRVLINKSVLVGLILGLAAINRWVLLPRVRRGGNLKSLEPMVLLEALLLVTVLITTGTLATTAPPEPRYPPAVQAPGSPGLEVQATLPEGLLSGRLQPDNLGLLHLTLELRDASGRPVKEAPGFTLVAIQEGTPPIRMPVLPAPQGNYHTVLPLPQGGTWKIRLEFAGRVLEYGLELAQ